MVALARHREARVALVAAERSPSLLEQEHPVRAMPVERDRTVPVTGTAAAVGLAVSGTQGLLVMAGRALTAQRTSSPAPRSPMRAVAEAVSTAPVLLAQEVLAAVVVVLPVRLRERLERTTSVAVAEAAGPTGTTPMPVAMVVPVLST